MPEMYKIRSCLLYNVFYCPISRLVISVASNVLAHIRAIRNIFILLAEKFKKFSHVERNKLDLKEIKCEV